MLDGLPVDLAKSGSNTAHYLPCPHYLFTLFKYDIC